ncbi:DMT family transporter [Paenibacillus lautus]|uniref:DMT family transporter n=1 Tax=Paenibacillus lautus TaxID=1401 RepID=UPI002DBB604D|nr:DMT family transporter [Paenibacillus lautus]MEC0206583.1 DMT family transporter [Paenibacillus lautus]
MKLSKTHANLALIIVAFLWGTSFTFIKQAIAAGMPPGLINTFRGLIFALLIYLFFYKIINKMTCTEFRVGLFAGVINCIVLQLQSVGLKYTTPSHSAFLTAMYVVILPFVTWLVFRKQPAKKSCISIALCLLGMAYLTGIVEGGFHIQLGDWLSVLAALALSFQIVYYGHFATGARPQIVAFMLGITQLIISGIYSLFFEGEGYQLINWSHAIIPVIILGVSASFLAQTLQIYSQKYTDVVTTGLILMTESLFASVVSISFGIEQLTNRLIIGGILIIIGLLTIQFNMQWLKIKKNK